MNCIIIDDEPLARNGISLLVNSIPELQLAGSFNSAVAAAAFLEQHSVDLIFLDIEMPDRSGLDFAKSLPHKTLVIFITAYTQYALHGYELDAIDYLVKPLEASRFRKAVNKALTYHNLLSVETSKSQIQSIGADFLFVKSERRYLKLLFKDILFIEGLKDYVIIHTEDAKVITGMNIRTIYQQLPQQLFARVSKSHIINTTQIVSFDNHSLLIRAHEIPIGNNYRDQFFQDHVLKNLVKRG